MASYFAVNNSFQQNPPSEINSLCADCPCNNDNYILRAKYFGRNLGIPELTGYTDVEKLLDSSLEGSYPFEEGEEWDGDESKIIKNMESMTLIAPVKVRSLKTKCVVARRIILSSSES